MACLLSLLGSWRKLIFAAETVSCSGTLKIKIVALQVGAVGPQCVNKFPTWKAEAAYLSEGRV